MRRSLLASLALVVAACGGGDDGGDDDGGSDAPPATDGGTIVLEQCGYELTTRTGASAPVAGEAVLGPDPTPRHVHLGFAADPSTSIAVQWRTADDQTLATRVQYGVGDVLDQTADGVTFFYYSGFNGAGDVIRLHETHLCGLEPDTEYSYRVGGAGADGNEAWSPTYRFRTAPLRSASDAEVVFAVLGDSRGGYDVLERLWEQVADHQPDLILFTGDAVTIGAVQTEWESFFDSGVELLANTPLISAHGNHELNAVHFYSQFAMPGDEENFAFDYGPAHVTVLNDTPVDPSAIEGAAADVLDAALTASADAPWKLVAHHRSMYSASTRHGSDETLRAAWGPIIDEHGVDLVLSGHDHNYERSLPLRGGEVQADPGDGTTYVVTGGAGASLYGNGSDFWTEVSEQTHSFTLLRIRATSLELQSFRDDGTMLDSLTIAR